MAEAVGVETPYRITRLSSDNRIQDYFYHTIIDKLRLFAPA